MMLFALFCSENAKKVLQFLTIRSSGYPREMATFYSIDDSTAKTVHPIFDAKVGRDGLIMPLNIYQMGIIGQKKYHPSGSNTLTFFGTPSYFSGVIDVFSVQKQLEKFEIGGLVVSKFVGRTRVYEFDPRYPFLQELKVSVGESVLFYPPEEIQKLNMNRRRPRRTGKPL
ncbi:MAG: hypothetical protein NTZ74_01610 [Chloroflexi bacterium]|nr:hypothetical protein [Chloroflexota bacterium]